MFNLYQFFFQELYPAIRSYSSRHGYFHASCGVTAAIGAREISK